MNTSSLDAATLEKLISAALAAPSIHNSQPWRFRFDSASTTIEVHAAAERMLRHTDPSGLALHLSAGAAVFNLRVAVAHFGWEPVVRLLPRPVEPGFLAAIRLAGPQRPGRVDGGAELYEALWRRRSSRFPFTGPPVPEALRTEIVNAVTSEGALLAFPGPRETSRILELTADAERYAATDPGRSAESRAWVRNGGDDGIPALALGPRDATGRVPVRDFTAGRAAPLQGDEPFEEQPAIGVLGTVHDNPADWLRAGQGLERALLVATTRGVRASLFSQAVEWSEVRWALRDPRGGTAHVHMLIRFGYGPEGPATPRRPVGEVLDRST
jgi:hypothetical protein